MGTGGLWALGEETGPPALGLGTTDRLEHPSHLFFRPASWVSSASSQGKGPVSWTSGPLLSDRVYHGIGIALYRWEILSPGAFSFFFFIQFPSARLPSFTYLSPSANHWQISFQRQINGSSTVSMLLIQGNLPNIIATAIPADSPRQTEMSGTALGAWSSVASSRPWDFWTPTA